MLSRLSAFVIWALIAATVVFWCLRLGVRPATVPAHSVAAGDAVGGRGNLSRLLGEAPVVATTAVPGAPVPEANARFRLVGIMAPRGSRNGPVGHGGLALIAVDGKPARAFAVGSRLDGELVLQSVSLRQASIGPAQGAQTVVLEIPRLSAAAAGKLGAPGAPGAPPPAARALVPQPPLPLPAVGIMQPGMPQPPVMPNMPGPVQRDGGTATQ